MSMGVFAGATGIVKCFYLFKFDPSSIATAAGLYIWESAEISATIMAASIPMLRKLALNAGTRDSPPESGENVLLSNFRRQLRIFGLKSEQTNNTTSSSRP
ncbi:hypothetical protein J7T55_000417 [Diaporthe amygdali]|uniref:uncharacterized protein n=1 Tax=Phomopsis amygdali TaxID=1214568 RepID=UPI0022FF1FA0|nr:uncharacterized protein J7T55_000417 [Diaporthe amygdali]KAJ0109491.1 hypothetical protein J7T55_000417 [Diaporthe amygdali]